jgi:hypothetical protein
MMMKQRKRIMKCFVGRSEVSEHTAEAVVGKKSIPPPDDDEAAKTYHEVLRRTLGSSEHTA